ncbi:MAG: tetraacyldisaccharide 4'-kinase [Myxococcaceae bacterium]
MNNDTEVYYTFSKRLEILWERLFFKIPFQFPPLRKRDQEVFRVPVPTISIGNLSMGGVGKTPFIIWLLERLDGIKVAVLHSGYKGGDEAKMLAAKFPKAFIWSNPKRHLGLEAAYQWGAELILIDDGFQCRRLHRDLDIVVLDASQKLANQRTLPFGRLRESPKALLRADLIIANHIESREQAILEIRNYSDAPVLCMRPVLEKITGSNAAVFCGLGNPKHFLNLIRAQGVLIKVCLLALDHEKPNTKTWKRFLDACERHQISQILCTEKDAARVSGLTPVPMKLEVF